MKYLWILCSFFITYPIYAQEQPITGLWYTHTSKEGVICIAEIYEEDNKYHAYTFNCSKDGIPIDAVDSKNHHPQLRSQPINGLHIIYDVIKEGNKGSKGRIYNAETGKTYYVRLSLHDKTTLNVRASADATGVFGHTLKWKLVEEGHGYRPIPKEQRHYPVQK